MSEKLEMILASDVRRDDIFVVNNEQLTKE